MMNAVQKYLRAPSVKKRFGELQAISGKTRYPILQLLSRFPSGLSVKELAEAMHASPSRISHQLAILRRHGLISSTKSGRTRSYRLERHEFLKRFLADT